MRSFSEALYLAVTCHDYPQLWDPAAPLAARREQLARAVAALPPEPFAPFSAAVWTGLDYEGATACLNWPGPAARPTRRCRRTRRTRPCRRWCSTATSTTSPPPPARGSSPARFPRSTFVETANTVHVSALGDRDGCAAPLVRRFIRRSTPATRAAPRGSPRSAPSTASRAAAGPPADPRAGDRSTPAAPAPPSRRHRGRRDPALALNNSGAAAACAAGAGATRHASSASASGARGSLRDVPVSGTATWRIADGAVRARLRLPGRGRLRVRWSTRRPLAVATLDGTLGGRRLRATMLAS